MSNELGKMLIYDALLEAEKLTGQSYKDDPETEILGILTHMAHNCRPCSLRYGLEL